MRSVESVFSEMCLRDIIFIIKKGGQPREQIKQIRKVLFDNLLEFTVSPPAVVNFDKVE